MEFYSDYLSKTVESNLDSVPQYTPSNFNSCIESSSTGSVDKFKYMGRDCEKNGEGSSSELPTEPTTTTEKPTAEPAIEEPSTEPATKEPSTEPPIEELTTEPPTKEPSTEPATESATEEPTTEQATEPASESETEELTTDSTEHVVLPWFFN